MELEEKLAKLLKKTFAYSPTGNLTYVPGKRWTEKDIWIHMRPCYIRRVVEYVHTDPCFLQREKTKGRFKLSFLFDNQQSMKVRRDRGREREFVIGG
jgi:hypothetical protein